MEEVARLIPGWLWFIHPGMPELSISCREFQRFRQFGLGFQLLKKGSLAVVLLLPWL